MWLAYACGSAFFAGITAILAKVGIKKIDSNLATAIRTIVVLIFAWIMVRLTGSYTPIGSIGTRTLIYLTLSGIATGASWLCYFRALQLGDVNKVTPIDKSSTILTMILAVIFLNEGLNEKENHCHGIDRRWIDAHDYQKEKQMAQRAGHGLSMHCCRQYLPV